MSWIFVNKTLRWSLREEICDCVISDPVSNWFHWNYSKFYYTLQYSYHQNLTQQRFHAISKQHGAVWYFWLPRLSFYRNSPVAIPLVEFLDDVRSICLPLACCGLSGYVVQLQFRSSYNWEISHNCVFYEARDKNETEKCSPLFTRHVDTSS